MINDSQADEPIRHFVRSQDDIEIDRYSDVGANGDLYFGKRKILGDRVALKFYFYNSHIASHEEPLLLREIKHENILEIFDAKIIDNQYAYFLTPEISGGDLQKFLEKNIVSTKTAINITQGILKGVNELHKEPNNLVHRDLKPNNILIDKENFRPYIADFGSIKKIPETKNSVVASKNTFIYKPYEALVNNEYTRQSDIYQIGVILFQLLYGHFPLAAADWLNEVQRKKLAKITGSFEQWQFVEDCITRKILSSKLLDLNTLPIYIDKSLKRIINTATNKDLSKRYNSCSEFLKALYDYSKKAKDWYLEHDVYHATEKNGTKYRVSKFKTEYILEISKKSGIWRKNNKHNGRLKDIILNLT